jgi:hypothetical protein
MDRNLQIALTAGALAIVWGYGLSQRLRQGDTQIQFKMIRRLDNPGTFWTIMIVVAAVEVIFVGMAVAHFAVWLRPAI